MECQDLIQFGNETEAIQNEEEDSLLLSGESSLDSEMSSSGSGRPPSTSNLTGMSFDSCSLPRLYSSSPRTNKENILDELLSDIRRSCATSLASTPTAVSFSEGEATDAFLDCKVRRSQAELRTLGKVWGKNSTELGH